MWHLSDPRTRRLFLLFLAAYVVFGATFTVIGAAIPQIISTFQWSYAITGFVAAANAAGYVLSTFLCGFLVKRFAPKRVLVTGLLVGAVGMSLFARTGSPWLNFFLGLAIGLCQGSIEVVCTLEVIHMERTGQSRLLNLMHAFFCLGAIIGPACVGLLVGGGMSGSVSVFMATSGLAALVALLFGLSAFPRTNVEPAGGRNEGEGLLRNPLLLLLTVYLLLYVGAENGFSTWVSEYFVRFLGTAASVGAFSVSLFWGGLLTGRLAISFSYHGNRQEYIMLGISLLGAAALAAMLLAHAPAVVAACVFLTGVGFSGLYPLAMAVVGRHFKSSVAVGTAATGGGIGSFTFPFLMAILAQRLGIRGGFFLCLGLSMILAVFSLVLIRRLRHFTPPCPGPRSGDEKTSSRA